MLYCYHCLVCELVEVSQFDSEYQTFLRNITTAQGISAIILISPVWQPLPPTQGKPYRQMRSSSQHGRTRIAYSFVYVLLCVSGELLDRYHCLVCEVVFQRGSLSIRFRISNIFAPHHNRARGIRNNTCISCLTTIHYQHKVNHVEKCNSTAIPSSSCHDVDIPCMHVAAWVGTIRRESTREEYAYFFSR